MGLAAMAFASCSNDDLLSGGDGSTKPAIPGEGEPTYFTFSFKVNNGTTRAIGDIGNHVVTTENINVDSAYLFIFNESSKVLENKFKVKPKDGKTQFTELVTAGRKKIYAIANPTLTMKRQIEEMVPKSSTSTMDKFVQLTFVAKDSAALDSLMPSADTMPMASIDSTNVCTLIAGVSASDAEQVGNDNHIALQLKRMVARTSLSIIKAEYANGKAGIVADSTYYSVRNQSKNTYLIQNKGTGVVKSPTYDYTDAHYIKNGQLLFGEYFFKDTDVNIKHDKSLYVAENTSFSFLKGAAPYILLHSRYIPERIVTDASFDVATQTVKYTYKDTPGADDVKTMVVSKSSVDEALLPNGLCFVGKNIFEKAVQAATTNKKDFTAAYTDYSNGSYYRINLGETSGGSTTYGTERNKSYKVNVNSVTGPGWNTEDAANETPTDPVDQKTYLNVSITVADWEDVEQDVDLN